MPEPHFLEPMQQVATPEHLTNARGLTGPQEAQRNQIPVRIRILAMHLEFAPDLCKRSTIEIQSQS